MATASQPQDGVQWRAVGTVANMGENLPSQGSSCHSDSDNSDHIGMWAEGFQLPIFQNSQIPRLLQPYGLDFELDFYL